MKTILFYFGHPAQYLFCRAALIEINKNHHLILLLKTKDVLENLVKNDGFNYVNILPDPRGNSKFSILFSLLKRIIKVFPIILRKRPQLMVSTDSSVAILGFFMRIHVITITEDDYEVIKTLGDLTYPFTSTILCPTVCSVGKWEMKKSGYYGYMKLGYLHPNVFSLNREILINSGFNKKYALIRIAKLTAHHDFGIKGIDKDFLEKIVQLLEKFGLQVFISSEGHLPDAFSKYALNIDPSHMHHILAGSEIFICDSQSMSVEAAMLGVPSIRYSSFVGRISVLEELEKKYRLTFGVNVGDEEGLLLLVKSILNNLDYKSKFQVRKEKMLEDKIDVSSFLVWFILNYPESKEVLKIDPNFQYTFK